MKIALVDMTNMMYMPYVNAYLNVMDLDKNEAHIIHWKREEEKETNIDPRVTIHTYDKPIDSSQSLKKKMNDFVKYRKYICKEIKKVSPGFLIIHNQKTAVLILDLLIGKYRKKYILDYRDIAYEKNRLFRLLISCIVKNSACTFISSEGYRRYLPDSEKIRVSHNINIDLCHKNDGQIFVERLKEKHTPLRLAFWGQIRNDKTNNAFIEAVSASHDVELHYFGTFHDRINRKPLNKMEAAENVFYHGSYSSADRISFARNTDILLNAFDKGDKNMPLAMSNKFYDGLTFYIPQICTSGSVMGEKCEKYGIGMTVDIDEPDFLNRVKAYFYSLDTDVFTRNCDSVRDAILKDMDEFKRIVNEAVERKSNDR